VAFAPGALAGSGLVLIAFTLRAEVRMRFCFIGVLTLLVAATPAAAQDSTSSPPPVRGASRSTPDFLFARPAGSVAIRGNWLFSRAGSDWYNFVTDQLTLKRRDFNAPGVSADVGLTLTDRLEAVIGTEFSQASSDSEYRHLVDNNRLPINQHTRLRQANVTGSVRLALYPRGRSIGSFAWIPRSVTPYVGAGGGMLWYRLEQAGDFVDYVDMSVFTDAFESQGWAPTAHVLGGVDVRVARRLFMTFDVRYRWAAADLNQQWINFDPIDLSGLGVSAGINVPF
jgi:hypothetical protein